MGYLPFLISLCWLDWSVRNSLYSTALYIGTPLCICIDNQIKVQINSILSCGRSSRRPNIRRWMIFVFCRIPESCVVGWACVESMRWISVVCLALARRWSMYVCTYPLKNAAEESVGDKWPYHGIEVCRGLINLGSYSGAGGPGGGGKRRPCALFYADCLLIQGPTRACFYR